MPVTGEKKPNDNLGNFTSYKEKYGLMKTKLKDLLYVSSAQFNDYNLMF